ncbi:coenzyme F420-0:L-glutamate ligase [Candidatus Bathyarchaeota archaeon]|nr:coenzyme F420-0:L-glutamate ligase [Candidatus Bathyarchaeota archaeon]
MKGFNGWALEGFPIINAGDDIARIIVETCKNNGLEIEDGDIIVIAQKVVSKAEDRVVTLRGLVPSEQAKNLSELTGKSARFVELVLKESKRVLKASRDILLVEDKRGLVCINAGIDKSNVGGRGRFALLPENPDASADRCRLEIRELTNKNVGVIISDTYSRPFRRGQVNFAIGTAGVRLFKDYRGKKDLFGQVLKVKNVAVVDELAAAAELLMGQAEEAMPVAVFKKLGHLLSSDETHDMADLFISEEEDLFKGVM